MWSSTLQVVMQKIWSFIAVFLLRVIESWKSALSEKINNIGPHAAFCLSSILSILLRNHTVRRGPSPQSKVTWATTLSIICTGITYCGPALVLLLLLLLDASNITTTVITYNNNYNNNWFDLYSDWVAFWWTPSDLILEKFCTVMSMKRDKSFFDPV